MVQKKSNPYSNFNFTIEFGDERGSGLIGGFEEIDGLGAPNTIARTRMPGLHKHTNLAMKRGVLGTTAFRVWKVAHEKGRPVQGILKIISYDKAKSQQEWTFTNVILHKVKRSDLKCEGNDISVETIEITAEGVAEGKQCEAADTEQELVAERDRKTDWKYVPIRRLVLFLEDSINKSVNWLVREPKETEKRKKTE